MTGKIEAVVIGVSAGALEALSVILPTLKADYPLPIIIVIHLPPDKKSIMVELLQSKCNIRICEAEDKEHIKPGSVYLAPPDYHLLIERDKYFSLSFDEPVLFSRPSINVLFETAADAYGPGLVGIILTGANSDGATGLKAIIDSGGTAVIQAPETAYASAMPNAAIEKCPGAKILNLEEISSYLQKVYL